MSKLLKHEIDQQGIDKLTGLLALSSKGFDKQALNHFVITEDWDSLALKQRIRRVSQGLHNCLDGDYIDQLESLKKVHSEFSGLFHLIFCDFVEIYGLAFFDDSMRALELFTVQSSAEFAVRPFIEREPSRAKEYLLRWASDDNEHLRRLSSEGVRPRLPWAKKISWIEDNPGWVQPIVEKLKSDQNRYVQKSVANLLNDLSKADPEWLFQVFNSWDLNQTDTKWIVKHALRTLLKKGDQRALNILGYPSPSHIKLQNWSMIDEVKIGERLDWSFTLDAEKQLGVVRLEYAIYFLRKQQGPYRKVFKISESEMTGKSKIYNAFHNFKKITTRTYIPGIHQFELILNGKVIKTAEFDLK
jgi:3-methyladenine DNA glycosylase AlkC